MIDRQDSTPVDVSRTIDEAKWTGLQRNVLLLCALAVILDGFDNQLLGFIIPALIKDWGVDRSAFVSIIAASLISMSVGTAIAGKLGDRFGRRPVMIGSVALFGVATLASAVANGLFMLALLRCLSAFGLGGAMPNATALLAEYAPQRTRSRAVAIGIICVPLGGLIAGLLAAEILPTWGWRPLLAIGGIAPLLGAAIMFFLLPESPGFLLDRAHRHNELRAILERITSRSMTAVPLREPERSEAGRDGSIFADDLLRDTLTLWTAFFFCLLSVYSMFNWAPTMLSQAGHDLGFASAGLAGFNFGGVIGALCGAFLMDRFGSRRPMVGAAIVGVLSSTAAAAMIANGVGGSALLAVLALQGAMIAGLQIMLFALAAHVYPATARATGVGAALAVGRLGAVASSVLGAATLAWGATAFLIYIGIAALLSGAFLLMLRRHISASAPIPRTLDAHDAV